jgi:type IX secretion system PorP/SprF family membrane protein
MKRLFYIISIVSLNSLALAQDPHWSMSQWNPIYINPAHSGFANKANRITALYRNQWRAVSVPYNTPMISYDRKVVQTDNGFRLGVSGQLLFDRAGDGNFTTFRPAIGIAVGKFFKQEKQYISLGIQGSYIRKQIDMTALKFGSQYGSGNMYDPNIPSGELLSQDHAGYFDLGLGLNYSAKFLKTGNLDVGTSVFNLNAPDYSFLSSTSTTVQRRYMAYVKSDIPITRSKKWEFNPAYFFTFQNKAKECLYQALFSVHIHPQADKDLKLTFGPGYRKNDAVIGYLGAQWNDLKVAFAFDGNISDLRTATQGRGAYELMLAYEWEKKKKEEPKPIIDTVSNEIVEEDTIAKEPELIPEPVAVIQEPIPPQIISAPETPKPPRLTYNEQIKPFLPLNLYFDNDIPKPTSTKPIQSISYDDTYLEYIKRKPLYAANHSGSGQFFTDKVESNFIKLNKVLTIIEEALADDKSVELELQGFASPLASDAYNEKLTENRIAVIEHYILEWNNSSLATYSNNGKLTFTHKPMGEATSKNSGISDNVKDTTKSVFSPEASQERRVEILLIHVH